MKKKVLFISLFAIVMVTFSFRFTSDKRNLESLMLENIEALASDEWTNPVCFGSGSVDCPVTHVKVDFVAEYYRFENRN